MVVHHLVVLVVVVSSHQLAFGASSSIQKYYFHGVPQIFCQDSCEITVIAGEIVTIVNNDSFDTLKNLLIATIEEKVE